MELHRLAAGDAVFSTLGYMGLYFVVGVGFLGLLAKTIGHGPLSLAHVEIATPIAGEAS